MGTVAALTSERLQRGVGVEVGAAEGEDGGDGGRRGVAVHDVRDAARVVGPAVPLAAVLLGLVEERLREVAARCGVEQREQLEL